MKWFFKWGVPFLGDTKGSQGGCEYCSDILLESRIMANKLLSCFLCFIWRLGELQNKQFEQLSGSLS